MKQVLIYANFLFDCAKPAIAAVKKEAIAKKDVVVGHAAYAGYPAETVTARVGAKNVGLGLQDVAPQGITGLRNAVENATHGLEKNLVAVFAVDVQEDAGYYDAV